MLAASRVSGRDGVARSACAGDRLTVTPRKWGKQQAKSPSFYYLFFFVDVVVFVVFCARFEDARYACAISEECEYSRISCSGGILCVAGVSRILFTRKGGFQFLFPSEEVGLFPARVE